MLSLEIRIEYADAETAHAVHQATVPDNAGYVESTLNGNAIVFILKSETAGALRNTEDDLLACVKAAESALGVVTGSAADLDGNTLFE